MKKNRMKSFKIWVLILLGIGVVINWGMAARAGIQQFQAKTVNHLGTGNVKIELKEYMEDRDGNRIEYDYDDEIIPGTYISKIPRVENVSSDCYIRVKIEYETELSLSEENILGISDQWVKRKEYWYYKPVLKAEEGVDFFTGIKIPEEWGEKQEEQDMILSIRAEAIQAKNFNPDYTKEDPWFGETVQYCLQEYGIKNGEIGKKPLYVVYEKDLSVNPNDFFRNLGKMMPGDYMEDHFTLENKNPEDASIWFRTQLPELLHEQKELLEKIQLSIWKQNVLLYQGNLASRELEDGILLGTVLAKGNEVISFSVSVPEELDNTYAFQNTEIQWFFETERLSPDVSVSTGEKVTGWIYLGAGLFCFFLMIVLWRGKKWRKI